MKTKPAFIFILSIIGYSCCYAQSEKTATSAPAQPQTAIITNESSKDLSKFEIDLFCCKDQESSDNLIWLSVMSDSETALTNGKYKFSKLNINMRKPFQFSGSIRSSNGDSKIIDGSFDVKINKGEGLISYDLKLENGKQISGKYTGKYKSENRIKN